MTVEDEIGHVTNHGVINESEVNVSKSVTVKRDYAYPRDYFGRVLCKEQDAKPLNNYVVKLQIHNAVLFKLFLLKTC